MRFEVTIPSTAICIGFTIWNFLRAFDHKKDGRKWWWEVLVWAFICLGLTVFKICFDFTRCI